MGICLDTDQQNGSQVFEDSNAQSVGKWRGEAGLLSTPPNGRFPTQNIGPVKFEPPTIPVIFVLGGPGSGKVTHCDNFIQEKIGITHINMIDLLQQYAIGNDMQDLGLLSSKTVAEVLMLEMKMSPNAKTFLISGYPRNMRDVVEYSEKIQVINGVVLVSWRQEVLERQIDYGAQLGHVILSLARMELKNFYRNVMPVAEYFDRNGILIEVNGERNPSEVYVDFREAIIQILGSPKLGFKDKMHQPLEAEVKVERTQPSSGNSNHVALPSPTTRINPAKTANKARKGLPSFIWVIGGPGSNKSNLCAQAIRNMPNWSHISVGSLFRTMASSNSTISDSIFAGEMIAQDVVMQLVEQQVLLNRNHDGIVIDGFPRDLNQVQEFESKFGQKPTLVLLDCSKLQLGRGKLDDSVPAFRKRLEIFREITLPMLKTLDSDNRLITIDGDTDVPSVQQEFEATLYQLMRQVRRKEEINSRDFAVSTPVDYNDDNKSNVFEADNINSNYQKTEMSNGRLKNGVNTISNHVINKQKSNPSFKDNFFHIMNGVNHRGVKKEIGSKIRDAVDENARITNDVLKFSRKNGNHVHLNGAANGASRIFQNGIGHLANGIPPGINRIAPAPSNATNNTNNKEPIKKMYSEMNGYHENLHM